MAEATIHIDGGSRGNPGPASYAVVLTRAGAPPVEESQMIGTATNNVAEYTALIRGLELARAHNINRLTILSDSELLVKQMNGEYKVKSPELQELYRRAVGLRQQVGTVTLQHVRREQNKRADFLCNEALDGRPRQAGVVVVESAANRMISKKPAATVGDDRVRETAIECLHSAAVAWAKQGPQNPPPEMIWEQLWSILEEAGVLRKK